MTVPRAILVPLGVLAVLCELALLVFNIVFAVTLSGEYTGFKGDKVEIVASVLNFVNVDLLLILLARQFQYRDGVHIKDVGHGRQHIYLLAGFCGFFCALSTTATAVGLCVIRNGITDLPRQTLGSSTESLMTGVFVVWAISLISEIVFIITTILIQRMDFHQQIQPFQVESGNHSLSKMKQTERQQDRSPPESVDHRGSNTVKSTSPPSWSRRLSVRNSLSQKTTQRPESLDSGYPESNSCVEDSFNFWDTSAVEPYVQQAVLGKSSPTPEILETIPATPTSSRSPSPEIPLDLEPALRSQPKSRSYSPANSHKDVTRKSSQITSRNGSLREAQIHPLFRSDSPTPPPAATPGTTITAAPGAGQVISDRQSIRSLHRPRRWELTQQSISSQLQLSQHPADYGNGVLREDRRESRRKKDDAANSGLDLGLIGLHWIRALES
ncbi:hypothetical protein F5884DRAFT_863601 [Xylogone sp. PMI_703]|nr:hypothetical protein F5884DRAFT_863601 [Xylogone sp. PMI_703]